MTIQAQESSTTHISNGILKPLGDSVLRQLKILKGVVTRLSKELVFYQREAEKLYAQLEEMKRSGACAYDLKQREEVHSESQSMIPQVESQLKFAKDKLVTMLSELERSSCESEDMRVLIEAAQITVESAAALIGDGGNLSSTVSPPEDDEGEISDTEY